MALIVAAVTFFAAAILLCGLWLFFASETQQELVRHRMDAVRKAERRGTIALDLNLLRDEMYSSVPILHRFLTRLSWTGPLQEFVNQSGLRTKAAKILLLSGVIGLSAFLIAGAVYRNFTAQAFLGLAFAAIPLITIAWMRRRRLREFEEHFPETLDLLGRAVRAGHAFTTGLEMVSKESPEPIASEFRTTFEEQNFGLPLRDVLIHLTERVPLVDVRFFVTALLVQKETGGNLAEILDELARVIRDRFRIYREVQVKTAQGRLTASILVALPVVMLVILDILNPSYVRVLFEDPIGRSILGGAAAMQIVGSLVIWKNVSGRFHYRHDAGLRLDF
jgi:tight adherence protein B